jgi:hypothetical protein
MARRAPLPDTSAEVANTPTSILDAWTALEVLAPQTFKRPEALAGGDRRAIASLVEKLSWEGAGEKARPNTRLFYQVVLGTVDFDAAVERASELASIFARDEHGGAVVVERHVGEQV